MKRNKKAIQGDYWTVAPIKRRDANHPAVKAFFMDKALKVKEILKGKTVEGILDCGCGNGFFQTYLTEVFNVRCIGLDYSHAMLRKNHLSNKICASVMKMLFPDNSFDLVTCHGLLHHLQHLDRIKAVQEMRRVARKYIFFGEPNLNNLASRLYALSRKEERLSLDLSMEYLQNLCLKCELSVKQIFFRGIVMPNKTPLFLLPLFKKV